MKIKQLVQSGLLLVACAVICCACGGPTTSVPEGAAPTVGGTAKAAGDASMAKFKSGDQKKAAPAGAAISILPPAPAGTKQILPK
jgi:hypothetical protein